MHRRREREIRDRFSASKKVLGVGGSCPLRPPPLSLANFCRRRISHSNRSFVTSPSKDAKWHRTYCLCDCACPTRSSSHQLLFFVKTLLLARDLDRNRDNGASDLKDSGSATPASIKLTFLPSSNGAENQRSRHRRKKRGALYAPRGATMDDDAATLELRSTSILYFLKPHARSSIGGKSQFRGDGEDSFHVRGNKDGPRRIAESIADRPTALRGCYGC